MSWFDELRDTFGEPAMRVHVIVKGHIGGGWYDVDRRIRLPEGATLNDLIARAEALGIRLQHAIDNSPHLRDTLMHNGERCPVHTNRDRVMNDGDEVYLLAPFAGG